MRVKLIFTIASAIFVEGFVSSLSIADTKCGYDNCPSVSDTKVNVHLIPHSHDDVGWLKTVDEYFHGVHSGIGVKFIISSVLEALKDHPDRRFTQVETAFFWKWWQEQSEKIREDYKKLVNNGQIEIANGAFVMNDEACVNYQSTIDQFTRGLRILDDTLGPCGAPKVGWQIDSYGHSREQALIFKQLGFDGAFVSRLDFNDRLQRMDNKTLDFLWGIDDGGIFYNVMMNHYSAPSGFCFDITCSDEPLNDDPESFEYNADRKMKDFESVLEEFANHSTTRNILIPMGGDFNYEEALQYFINMDKLIKLFKNNEKYNVFYSTPSCYIQAVSKEKPTLDVKTDDFFPYASEKHEYWTGYYTSRPNLKRFERTAHNILQASKQLRAIFKMNINKLIESDSDSDLSSLQDSIAIMQHHDAVSGTAKQTVANDYIRNTHDGIIKSEKSIGMIIGSLLSFSLSYNNELSLSSCLLSNISICEASTKDRFIVSLYNPLSRQVSHHVRLPVNANTFAVVGPKGEVVYDVVSSISNFDYVTTGSKPAANDLVFSADDIPPFGINLYYVTVQSSETASNNVNTQVNMGNSDTTFGTDKLNFVMDRYGKLKSVTMNNRTQRITQEFLYYQSETGINSMVASGSYLFRPVEGTKYAKSITEMPGILESHKGKVVDEAHVKINDWIKQIIRVYKDGSANYIEFDWMVGPIDVNETSRIGKEIISRFTVTNFKNDGVFYTDSNGREMIKRTRNQRQGYTYDSSLEPIASNYYPVTSNIAMIDESKKLELAVLTDRSQGGSSLKDGQLELMIHRRMLVDDNKGLSEALDEQEFDQGMVARGQHYLIFGNIETDSVKAQEYDLQSRILLAPYTLVADATAKDLTLEHLQTTIDFQLQFINQSLPDNVNILTLERWRDEENTYLLRLEHTFESNADEELSKEVTLDVSTIFYQPILDIKETTLGANILLDDFNKAKKFTWITQQDNDTVEVRKGLNDPQEKESDLQNETDPTVTKIITLKPLEIRTFIIKFEE